MTLLQAFVLGAVQGLSEFLPISSSAHLTLVPFIVGWDEPTLAFDVAVHIGTLVAVVWAFRDRVAEAFGTLRSWKSASDDDRQVIRLLAIGTVPAVVVGGVFEGLVENAFHRPVLIAMLLGVTAYLLFGAERHAEERTTPAQDDERAFTVRDALFVGLAQAVAVMPGISRSGATIVMGMRRGYTRGAAARFSFLLSIPVIVGATVFKLPDMVSQGMRGDGPAFAVGIVTAGVTGFLAIRWFLGVVQRRGLRGFGVYCVLLMIASLLTALARG